MSGQLTRVKLVPDNEAAETFLLEQAPVKRPELSLIQRLWLLLLCLMSLSIGSALIANLLNARSYLEQQLTAQNADTANSLAMMLTQYKADPVMAQTLLNAAFEQGHFAEVRWDTPPGRMAIRLRNIDTRAGTPTWFQRWLTLAPQPGMAPVSNGWSQAGRIAVSTDPGYAYQSLWQGAQQTVLWLGVIGLLAAMAGSQDIRRLRRQLGIVIRQAQDISEQRFVQIPLPRIPELAEVVRAMNHMVTRLQNYLDTLRGEVDRLRKDVLTDVLTGLPNREGFERYAENLLMPADDPLRGYFLLIRIAGLAELNQRLGGETVDRLLKYVASDLSRRCLAKPGWMATRLRGADFALLCPEAQQQDADDLARTLCAGWAGYQRMGLTDQPGVGYIGMVDFNAGDPLDCVLARAGQALILAEVRTMNSWSAEEGGRTENGAVCDLDWLQLIGQLCRESRLQLRWYPVRMANGEIAWHEGMLFCPKTDSTAQMSALRLVSEALRVGRVHELDLHALTLALKQGPSGVCAINLSPDSLAHPAFLPQVLGLLGHDPARRIHFEFTEICLEAHWDALLAFSQAVRPLGHQLAVEILGYNLTLVARTHEARIAYLVLDGQLTHNIANDAGRTALLYGLLKMAALMSIQLEAKGVTLQQDHQRLIDIGIHYLTGPAV
jgi:EAL domain-containing protein (putative c-di-GMP-specific phosphodiesterase class I)/GGDEF domain-containing protein